MNEESIFAEAFEKAPGAERQRYLDEVCGANSELRRHIEDLLSAAENESGMLDRITAAVELGKASHSGETGASPSVAIGSLIAGRYRILERIGEGGMGEVFVAEQIEPVRRKVALKLIKPGFDSRAVLSRFEKERQALAIMDHPHIAKIFDGGVTELGRPYFVMEYLKGSPITEYCDSVRMPIRERLQLFRSACDAVQHAHQKGVIHRDLKPSNILVALYDDKPVVKVIDFGLAKSVEGAGEDQTHATGHAMVVGTPLYMSPEQAQQNNLDIDTRSDVYALGVILYELLTGSTPIERERFKKTAWNEAMRLIREVDPPTPSTRISSTDALPSVAAMRQLEPARLSKLVRGELDWIVMKALEKERSRRYESASALEKDIGNYLQGDAVTASPPSKIYRLRKFARRNKLAIGTAALVFFSLSAGLAVAGYGLFQANAAAGRERLAKIDAQAKQKDADKQRLRAEEREKDAVDAIKHFADVVANSLELKNSPSLGALRKELLQKPLGYFRSLRERLQAETDTRPQALADLVRALYELGILTGQIENRQGFAAFDEAKAICERLVRENPRVQQYQEDLARIHTEIGLYQLDAGKIDEALAAIDKATNLWAGVVNDSPADERQEEFAKSYGNFARVLIAQGKPLDAMKAYETSMETLERLVNRHPRVSQFQSTLAGIYADIASTLSSTGRSHEAISMCNKAINTLERVANENPTVLQYQDRLARCYAVVGNCQFRVGDIADGIKACERARGIWITLSREHPTVISIQLDLASIHRNIGHLLRTIGKPAEAVVSLEQAMEIRKRIALNNPKVSQFQADLAVVHNDLGLAAFVAGRSKEALEEFQRARKLYEQLVVESPAVVMWNRELGGTLSNMSIIYLDTGKFDQAADLLVLAIERQEMAISANPSDPAARAYLKGHYENLVKAAQGLQNSELLIRAENGLAEIARNDPRFAQLDEQINAILHRKKVATPVELVQLARRAYDTGRFVLAAKFWGEAFQGDAELQEDRQLQLAYNAACSALLANSGMGTDAQDLNEEAKLRLRQQGMVWLKAELTIWLKLLDSATTQQRNSIMQTLKHWQQDSDLECIRDAAQLEKLPEPERQQWQELWKQVADLETKTRDAASKPSP